MEHLALSAADLGDDDRVLVRRLDVRPLLELFQDSISFRAVVRPSRVRKAARIFASITLP
jgi:hypothetical protein